MKCEICEMDTDRVIGEAAICANHRIEYKILIDGVEIDAINDKVWGRNAVQASTIG